MRTCFSVPGSDFLRLLPSALGFLETPLICSVNCLRRPFTMLLPKTKHPVGGGCRIYTHVSLTLQPVPWTTRTTGDRNRQCIVRDLRSQIDQQTGSMGQA